MKEAMERNKLEHRRKGQQKINHKASHLMQEFLLEPNSECIEQNKLGLYLQ